MKGAAIREFLLWYERRHGHGALLGLFERVPPSLISLVDPTRPAVGILPASWYPVSLTHPMLTLLVDRFGNEGRALAFEANREVVPRMIRGLYRVLFKTAATPERYARHVQRLWRNHHTTGNRSVTIVAPGEAVSTTENWPGHHPLLCWVVIYTMAFVFEQMGYPHWTVERTECVEHGGSKCQTVLRYRA
jgi:hypothetical protein